MFTDLLAVCDQRTRVALGESVTYAPSIGVAVAVRGVFDAAHVLVDAGTGAVMSVGPAVFLSLSDLPSNPETDTSATVTVAGVVYLPHTVKPDGLGGVVLLMHKVA